MRKRIALFIANLTVGGAERVVVNLANGLADRGQDVDIVLVRAHGELLSGLSENVRIVDLGRSRLVFSVAALSRYLRQTRPAVLISSLDGPNIIALLAAAASGTNVATVATVHNHLSAIRCVDRSMKRRLIDVLIKRLLPRANAVVAVSRGVADDLLSSAALKPSSVHVINNPVLTPRFQHEIQQAIEESPTPGDGQRAYAHIVAIGRLSPEKDFVTLVRAVKILVARRNVRLTILGEGPERSTIEQTARELGIEDVVRLEGFVFNIAPYLAMADVVAVSSLTEGLSIVIVEAMAAGRRIVSCDCPVGPRELLEGGRLGTLVAVQDPEAMAEGIDAALRTDPDVYALARRASEFTLENATGRYVDLISGIGSL